MKKTLLSILFSSLLLLLLAQNNVGVGTNTPNQYAKLDIASTDKGLLTPRMTTALRIALTTSLGNTEQGLIVFDTDLQKFFYWDKNQGMTGNWNEVRTGSISNGKIWIGNATNESIEQTMSGDATITNTGVIDLSNNAVETSEINNNSVDGSKINITGNTNGSMMYYNGTDWVNIAPGSSGQVLKSNGVSAPTWGGVGKLNNITVLTTGSGTYTLPLGVSSILVKLVGAGGGGGSAHFSCMTTRTGAGGGAGAYSEHFILSPSATYAYIVGSGGTANNTGGCNGKGNDGTSTTFGTITAGGGIGGDNAISTSPNISFGGNGGVASGGTINIDGAKGGMTTINLASGYGANSIFGGGGAVVGHQGLLSLGNNGSAPGAGGSGASTNSSSFRAGGTGGSGIIIIYEYY